MTVIWRAPRDARGLRGGLGRDGASCARLAEVRSADVAVLATGPARRAPTCTPAALPPAAAAVAVETLPQRNAALGNSSPKSARASPDRRVARAGRGVRRRLREPVPPAPAGRSLRQSALAAGAARLSAAAAALYRKGDVGRALRPWRRAPPTRMSASRSDGRLLRVDPHPDVRRLAAFASGHPTWPGRAWIRSRQEAELSVTRSLRAGGDRRSSPATPPHSRARASSPPRARASGTGRAEEAIGDRSRVMARRRFRRLDGERDPAGLRRRRCEGRP